MHESVEGMTFWEWAQKFARSGECSNWLDVEGKLARIGFADARGRLDNHTDRDLLDAECADAQAIKGTDP